MTKEILLSVRPESAFDKTALILLAAKFLEIEQSSIKDVEVLRRSLDARSKHPVYLLKLNVWIDEVPIETNTLYSITNFKNLKKDAKTVLIIGAGPAGLFAALQLLERGIKPIIIERGKDIKERRRDLANITRNHLIDIDSNYCFGEGGAGTYSDGKLYTRSTKRGDITKVLKLLVQHGAPYDILVEAHPHIGTNKLPKLIENIRATIIENGGEIYFNHRVNDFLITNDLCKGVAGINTITNESFEFTASNTIIATGHSARDIFELLHTKNVFLESKQFAIGVRIEHPQDLIDSIQYRCEKRMENLPPAAYSLVTQAKDKGVYSFCMCPGGIIAPCATEPEQIVTNGWSPSKRNNPFANSGMVVEVVANYYKKYADQGPLAGLYLQREIERLGWIAGGKTQVAPAQRMIDFMENKLSSTLPSCSYIPGIHSSLLNELLPPTFVKPLQDAFLQFNKKMSRYVTNEAVLVGFETRTSSPVRIPRNPETLIHVQIKNLYPCGEGAGYAGGIVSAAIDGQRVANAI